VTTTLDGCYFLQSWRSPCSVLLCLFCCACSAVLVLLSSRVVSVACTDGASGEEDEDAEFVDPIVKSCWYYVAQDRW
jgi:hypothetical protein